MLKPLAACVGLFFCHALAAQSQTEELETVLVTGEVPGPGLWKVSRGDHELWILGSYSPLSKDMKWRTTDVERRISASQEVIFPGGGDIAPDIGLFRALTLLPALLKAGKNPGGGTLKDVLPAETYSRWRVLKDKYIGADDDVEKWRPAVAIDMLYGAAMRKAGLAFSGRALSVVDRTAKQQHIPMHAGPLIKRRVKVENPRGMLNSAQKMKLPDVECFARGLERLESRVESLKRSANAWARGDIDGLRETSTDAGSRESCIAVLQNALVSGELETPTQTKQVIDEMTRLEQETRREVDARWLFEVRAALDRNRSTFAVVPVRELLRQDGFLSTLRNLGYEVQAPQ